MKNLGWAALAMSVAGFVVCAGFDGWRLMEGYDIEISMNAEPVSAEHVDFPGWRLLLQPLFVAAVLGWIGLRLSGRAPRGAGLLLALGVAALAVLDFREYGLATPTSLGAVAFAGAAGSLAATLKP